MPTHGQVQFSTVALGHGPCPPSPRPAAPRPRASVPAYAGPAAAWSRRACRGQPHRRQPHPVLGPALGRVQFPAGSVCPRGPAQARKTPTCQLPTLPGVSAVLRRYLGRVRSLLGEVRLVDHDHAAGIPHMLDLHRLGRLDRAAQQVPRAVGDGVAGRLGPRPAAGQPRPGGPASRAPWPASGARGRTRAPVGWQETWGLQNGRANGLFRMPPSCTNAVWAHLTLNGSVNQSYSHIQPVGAYHEQEMVGPRRQVKIQ